MKKWKIIDTGDRQNAHYMPAFADKLIADTKYLPLWSCICRDKFRFGRIPASSASIEGDFHIIINIFLKNELTPMRADLFITKHVILSGRVKLINTVFQDKEITDNRKSYRRKNICNKNEILATRKIEDWRGLISKIMFRGRYL